jgi:hypothetical protein
LTAAQAVEFVGLPEAMRPDVWHQTGERTLATAHENALTISSLDVFDQDCVAIAFSTHLSSLIRERSASSM